MGDLNKAPNDFFNNLENTKTIRYNSVIQIQIKSLNEKKIVQAMQFEIAQFPEDSQMINQNTIYLSCYETWLHDLNFWKESSVYDAFELFMRIARENTYYFKEFHKENPSKDSSQQIKNESFALYQLTSLWFSWHAIRDRSIRKSMGIKKNIFG
tara:strand:- start:68 stop:529 length:462 start_codon:yes stop_codon:yes gene_type:complete